MEFLKWFREEWNDRLGQFYIRWFEKGVRHFCKRGTGVHVYMGLWPWWYVESEEVRIEIIPYDDDDDIVYKEHPLILREGVLKGPGVVLIKDYRVSPWHFDYILIIPSMPLNWWLNIKENWRRYEVRVDIYHVDGVWGVVVRLHPRRCPR